MSGALNLSLVMLLLIKKIINMQDLNNNKRKKALVDVVVDLFVS